MSISKIMSTRVDACAPETDLAAAAMIMWRGDCGIVPVVESESSRLVGVITDRDICMAAGTKHRPIGSIPVADVMIRTVVTCRPSDSPRNALARMAEHAVRRLPVVDEKGRLVGMLSIADLIRATESPDHASDVPAGDVVSTLRSICHRPRTEKEAPVPRASATRGSSGTAGHRSRT
jgi:CBS domain-containing protein